MYWYSVASRLWPVGHINASSCKPCLARCWIAPLLLECNTDPLLSDCRASLTTVLKFCSSRNNFSFIFFLCMILLSSASFFRRGVVGPMRPSEAGSLSKFLSYTQGHCSVFLRAVFWSSIHSSSAIDAPGSRCLGSHDRQVYSFLWAPCLESLQRLLVLIPRCEWVSLRAYLSFSSFDGRLGFSPF